MYLCWKTYLGPCGTTGAICSKSPNTTYTFPLTVGARKTLVFEPCGTTGAICSKSPHATYTFPFTALKKKLSMVRGKFIPNNYTWRLAELPQQSHLVILSTQSTLDNVCVMITIFIFKNRCFKRLKAVLVMFSYMIAASPVLAQPKQSFLA